MKQIYPRPRVRQTTAADGPRFRTTTPRATLSIRPRHLEHGFGPDLKIVAAAAGADDGTRQRGLVDAVLDEGLVDVDRDDLAERKPGLRLLAVGALQLDDLRQLAFERYRTLGHAGD